MNREYLTYVPTVETWTAHSAITDDATSGAIEIAGARGVGIIFTEGGTVNNRQADLTVTVSGDGTNFYAYSMLISNAANTNVQDLTRVATKNRAAAGTDILWLTPETLGGLTHLKVVVDVTDAASPTGNFTVKVIVTR